MTTGKREKPFKLDMSFGEALNRFAGTRPSEVESQAQQGKLGGDMEPKQGEFQLVHYNGQEGQADFALDPSNETVWATQQQIADAFKIDRSGVTKHLRDIFAEGELDEKAVCAKFARTAEDGKTYQIQHYNLEAILSVGYRINSKRATAFRQWATRTLKDYIIQGFALDEQRLRDDPRALNDLAARVRALRADEKNIYQAVRDVFAIGSSDYDAGSQTSKSFYARFQDRFLHAATGMTAAELKLTRADHKLPSMGLMTIKGEVPERADANVGKNYLYENELYSLHILCEQFMLFVQSSAIKGKTFTMSALAGKFEELMHVQGHTAFPEYQQYIALKANAHAQKEFDLWRERVRKVPRDQKRLA